MANEQMREIRSMVRGAYDLQALRVQIGGRLVANFKAKLGQAPSTPEKDLEEEEKKVLRRIRDSYKKFTDGVKVFPRQAQFKGDEIISSYADLCLVSTYVDLEAREQLDFRRLESALKEYRIYTEFLEPIRGIGPAMAGVIMSEIDITKARYPSSLWMYAGLDVAPDGKGRSSRKEHLVKTKYTNRDGEEAEKMGITHNRWLKTKLVGVLGTSFIRQGDNHYSRIYRDYKNRVENHPNHADKTKQHRHNMAIRYMIKIFLIDLHMKWREIEGLPGTSPYHEAKLNIYHKGIRSFDILPVVNDGDS